MSNNQIHTFSQKLDLNFRYTVRNFQKIKYKGYYYAFNTLYNLQQMIVSQWLLRMNRHPLKIDFVSDICTTATDIKKEIS